MSGNEERARGIGAKSKGRATLFEVLRGDEPSLRGEKHRSREAEPRPREAAEIEDSTPPPPQRPVVRAAQPEFPRPAPAETDEGGAAPPLVELDDDRIRVSLTSVGCAFVVFVFAMSIFAGFKVGWHRGHTAGAAEGYEQGRASYVAEVNNDIDLARSEPAETDVVGNLLERSPSAAEPKSAVTTPPERRANNAGATNAWIPDYTYIVVQEFLSGRESDAQSAQAYLAEAGIDTALITTARGTTQLITTQGFNRNDPTQRQLADQLLSRVHETGADYYASGGGYKLEGYFKTLKGDSW